jgi:S1-C subfamily serine protease
MLGLLLVFSPASLGELKFSIPYYTVGMIFAKGMPQPVGSGFVFENTRYVVTARHVLIDSENNEQELSFEPLKGLGSDPIGPFKITLKPHRTLEKEDIAVLEMEGPPLCKEALTRGPATSLRGGDTVGFGGFDRRVPGYVRVLNQC